MKKLYNIEIDGVRGWDCMDFVDAYISYAEYKDGTALTEEELLNISAADTYDYILERLF